MTEPLAAHARFYQAVTRSFQFLVDEHHFAPAQAEILNTEVFDQAEARITYARLDRSVQVRWAFAPALIEVLLLAGDSSPLRLYDQVQQQGGEAEILLARPFSTAIPHIMQREAQIEREMEAVIENLAILTRKYAGEQTSYAC